MLAWQNALRKRELLANRAKFQEQNAKRDVFSGDNREKTMLKKLFITAALPILTAASLPETGPVPPMKPTIKPTVQSQAEDPKTTEKVPEAPASGEANIREHQEPENPQALSACLDQLTRQGVGFRKLNRQDGPGACGIEQPVELSEPAKGLVIEPPAILRCQTAAAIVDWTREMLLPAARRAYPQTQPVRLVNASSYVCRNRNSAETGKISEHAKGNALDLARIDFADGQSLMLKPRDNGSDFAAAFQHSMTASACLYFTTVLSPGSDATHQDHLHLDILERTGGYRYCR